MSSQVSAEDRVQINAGIREKYNKVAATPAGHFKYPTGQEGLKRLHYDDKQIADLPDTLAESFCGVGNPFSLGKISLGERVLDIGCGAGVDSILAALIVGPKGSVVGVDIVPEMIARAEYNRRLIDLDHVHFQKTSGENLPFAADTFDVVISNGAINLIPDKEAAMSEVLRVLKPAGRLLMADQIAAGNVQKDLQARFANWFQ